MRFNPRHPASRLVILTACCASLAACGGGGSGGSPYNGYSPNACNPGTDIQLANPTPNSYGVSTNIGSITIVANGNGNQLYNSYTNWAVVLLGNYGQINGGQLNLVSDSNGPHPFPSDYYYSSSVPSLPGGQSFQVDLVNTSGSCNPVTIGNFST